MKKRVLSRILTVVLVCTMLLGLVGFAPMVETLSGSQQTIAAVDGSTGDIKDTPDAGGTDKDTGDTGDAGEKEPEPDPDPEPEPKPEPDPGKCIVTIEQPDGGTITCAELPESGQVEKGTKLTFTVSKAENVVSSELVAVRVNENALDISKDINKKGEFTVTITENTTISAEFFGIRSIKVWDADAWTQSKNVTIETIGSVSSKSYENLKGEDVAIEGNNFEVTDNIGKTAVKYTITVEGGGAADGKTATADAEVKLVDSEPPKLESEVESVKNNNDYKGYKYHCIVTVRDNGSGVKTDSLRICDGTTEWKLEDFGKAKVDANKDGTVVQFEFCYKNNTNYFFKVKDRVGNWYVGSVVDDSAPDITGYEMEHGSCKDAEKNIWWAGKDAKLTVSACDAGGIQSFKLLYGENPVTKLETAQDADGEYKALFSIDKSGEYTVVVTDKSGHKAEETITIQYDPNAPVFQSAKYTTSADGNWFKGLLNKITNGGLFSETVGITVAVNDVAYDKDTNTFASGVAKVEYSLVKTTTANASADKAERDGSASQEKWKGTELVIEDGKASIPIQNDFTGYIELRATDNAGNESFVTVEYDKENPDNSGKLEITNKATYGEGDLIVMAKTGNDTDQKAYTKAEGAENPEVVRSVDFDIYTTAPDLPAETPGTAEITKTDGNGNPVKDENGNVVKETVKTTTTYSYDEMTVTATYGNEELSIEDKSSEDEAAAGNRTYAASIGKNGDVRFNGVVTFTVTYKIKATTKIDGTDKVIDTPQGLEGNSVKQTVSVPVRVQNHLDAPEIELGGTPNDNSWFNSNGNPLTSVNLKTPDGLSDVTTAYTIWYWENGQSEEEAVKLPKTLGADEPTGTITNAAGGNQTVFKGTELFKDVKDTQIQKAGYYKITAVSTDKIGNSKEAKSLVFKYDATAPMIEADFKDVMQPSANGKYYNIQRTVTISVTDEGFTGTEDLTNAEKITCKSGADALREEAWTWTTDHWECRYSYGVASGDARDGDDYELTVSVTDNAGNTSRTDKQGLYYINGSETAEPEASHYTGAGQANNQFTIDQTKPVVSVVFDNNSARNEKYFSAGRTATITVTEHNFKPELSVSMTAENATAGADAKEGWTQNGDVWTKTVTFDPQDAVCKFSITVTDLAGNECPDEDVNYGSRAAPREFVIDQVNPALEITGTNATPYADACAPGFTAHDTNMSTEYTMTLTRTVRASRNANVSDRFLTRDSVTVTGTDINAVFNTITEEAENDGIYILDVTVMDMAGNSTQTTSTFTVNRHGSFYIFNEALADVVNAKYVQKADGSYQVTEYNASPLVGDSVKIEIYRDGQLVTTLTPTVGAGVIGASGLYEYTYDLPAEHFAQNGRYKVALSSLDEAKNESDNTKLDDALLEFTVDSVAPEITMIKGLEKGIVNAKELTFSAAVMDTYGIASVQILVDGKVVKEYVTQEAYDALKAGGQALDHEYAVLTNTLDAGVECKLLESNSRQHVVIAVTDMAGNVTQTDSKDFAPSYDFHENVLVSTNFWARYIHNVWALVVTGVVILALAGGIWYVTAKKKKEHTAA